MPLVICVPLNESTSLITGIPPYRANNNTEKYEFMFCLFYFLFFQSLFYSTMFKVVLVWRSTKRPKKPNRVYILAFLKRLVRNYLCFKYKREKKCVILKREKVISIEIIEKTSLNSRISTRFEFFFLIRKHFIQHNFIILIRH